MALKDGPHILKVQGWGTKESEALRITMTLGSQALCEPCVIVEAFCKLVEKP